MTLNRLDVSEVKEFSLQAPTEDEDSDIPKENIREVMKADFSYEDYYLPTLISNEGLSLALESKRKFRLIILM